MPPDPLQENWEGVARVFAQRCLSSRSPLTSTHKGSPDPEFTHLWQTRNSAIKLCRARRNRKMGLPPRLKFNQTKLATHEINHELYLTQSGGELILHETLERRHARKGRVCFVLKPQCHFPEDARKERSIGSVPFGGIIHLGLCGPEKVIHRSSATSSTARYGTAKERRTKKSVHGGKFRFRAGSWAKFKDDARHQGFCMSFEPARATEREKWPALKHSPAIFTRLSRAGVRRADGCAGPPPPLAQKNTARRSGPYI